MKEKKFPGDNEMIRVIDLNCILRISLHTRKVDFQLLHNRFVPLTI